MCLQEPPHETGKRNALSGFSFALTLVNVQSPEILRAFLKCHAQQFGGCADGIQAALSVWGLSGGSSQAAELFAAADPFKREAISSFSLPWPARLPDQDRGRPEVLFSTRLQV